MYPALNRTRNRHLAVSIVSSYPPPYSGGMAIYAEQLSTYLNERGFECTVIDIGRGKREGKADHVLVPFGGRILKYFSAAWLLIRKHVDLIQICSSSDGNFWGSLLISFLIGPFRGKVVFSLRGGKFPEKVSAYGPIRRMVARLGLSVPDFFLSVNESIKAAQMRLGISSDKIVVIPAFSLQRLSSIAPREDLPSNLLDFCATHSPVIVAGPRLEIQSSGGWQTPILALPKLKNRFPTTGMVIVGSGDKESECRQMIRSHKLSEDMFLTGDLPHPALLGVFQHLAEVLVRPTMNDGDSSFVREGLALCKAVVASDTDFRPDGVILFKKGDAEDLVEKVEYALENRKEIEARLQKMEHPDYFAETVKLYERLLSPRSRPAREQ